MELIKDMIFSPRSTIMYEEYNGYEKKKLHLLLLLVIGIVEFLLACFMYFTGGGFIGLDGSSLTILLMFFVIFTITILVDKWIFIGINTVLYKCLGKRSIGFNEGVQIFLPTYIARLIIILVLNLVLGFFPIPTINFSINYYVMTIDLTTVIVSVWLGLVYFGLFKDQLQQTTSQSIIKYIIIFILTFVITYILQILIYKVCALSSNWILSYMFMSFSNML